MFNFNERDNSTANWSLASIPSSEPPDYEDPVTTASITIVHIMMIAVTIMGNLFVIFLFVCKKKLVSSKPAYRLILNLAFSDLTVGVVSLTVNCAWWIMGDWPFGEFLCKLYIIVDCTTVYVSVLTVIGISFDRMLMVTRPFQYRVWETSAAYHRGILFCLFGVWTVSAIFYGIITFTWSIMTGEYVIDYEEDCESEFSTNVPFGVALVFIELVIPLIVLVVLNVTIYRNIRNRWKRLKRHSMLAMSRLNNSDGKVERTHNKLKYSARKDSLVGLYEIHKLNNVAKKKRELLKHQRLALRLTIFVGAFLLTWLPYCVTVIMYNGCKGICISDITWEVVNLMLWFNSTLNPFLYAAMNTKFRHVVLSKLCCRRNYST